MNNEIAVVEQLAVITDKIKTVGAELDKRLEELKLDNLICTEETKKSIKNLRTELSNELKEFESQRKAIKTKIMQPYEDFNEIYEREIKEKYQNADKILADKINFVEDEIKRETKEKMLEFFNEYKQSKTVIKDEYLSFEDLNIKIGLNLLTDKKDLVKKVKDEIREKVDIVASDIETISTMQANDEILAEYLKHKNLQLAIKEVNERHARLAKIQEQQEQVKQQQIQEQKTVEKVEEVLQAPTIVEETKKEKICRISLNIYATYDKLQELYYFLKNGGYKYEQAKQSSNINN